MSGQGSQALTANLAQGSNVTVGGFITYQTGRNGVSRVVLHAEHIKLI
ncbi:primosomal replicatioN protein n [Aliivibrio fischeri MJ11]|uniref:Primosomal replicatioN protein n n=1 Tax=Aliivibrio fischeri (strain MJ11) TaxID=388396 RepID=B5FBQ2_ALIFM|nr:primosomal replicatioN protein n [Aliivibrio fischeri MJ11]